MPLSGLSISAVADQVVVREGRSRWQADSGQYLLEFEGNPAKGRLEVIERDPRRPKTTRRDGSTRPAALEDDDPRAAVEAYQRAIEAGPLTASMRASTSGALLHESRRFAKAEQVYRAGARGVRRRSAPALQPGRAARRPESPHRGDRGLFRRRCASTRPWPMRTTT
jgi:hypothetical protein